MKTITKLWRGAGGRQPPAATLPGKDTSAIMVVASGTTKRSLECDSILLADLERFGAPSRSAMDELWEEVHSNGDLLLQLKEQQKKLHYELKKLREEKV